MEDASMAELSTREEPWVQPEMLTGRIKRRTVFPVTFLTCLCIVVPSCGLWSIQIYNHTESSLVSGSFLRLKNKSGIIPMVKKLEPQVNRQNLPFSGSFLFDRHLGISRVVNLQCHFQCQLWHMSSAFSLEPCLLCMYVRNVHYVYAL